MKRIFSMLCAVAICLGMAGCGANKPVGDDPTAVYLDGEKVISLGMSEDEIESILTLNDEMNEIVKSRKKENSHTKVYENAVFVGYTDNIANNIHVIDEEDKYNDCFGNHIGMNYNKAKSNINKKFITENEEGLVVYFNKEGKILTEENFSEVYSAVRYTKDDKDNISGIMMSLYL